MSPRRGAGASRGRQASSAPKARSIRAVWDAWRRRNDPDGPSRQPTMAFPLVVMILVVVGCLTLLTINVTVSNQAFELRNRRATVTSQSLVVSDLQGQVYAKSAPAALADAAAKLGMVPNPYPNFIDLRTGAVSTGMPVTGSELAPLLTPPPAPTKSPTPLPTASSAAPTPGASVPGSPTASSPGLAASAAQPSGQVAPVAAAPSSSPSNGG